MDNKYKLTSNYIEIGGRKLFQIQALKSFYNVKSGELGGYIESESNLSQNGNAWVYGNAHVFDNAYVYDNSRVYGNAHVYDAARISGNAYVFGNAHIFGNAQVSGDACVSGNAQLCGYAQVFSNDCHCGFDCFGSENRHIHAYRIIGGSVEIICGCFRGSIDKFEKQVHETHGGTIFEKQYLAVIQLIKIKFNL